MRLATKISRRQSCPASSPSSPLGTACPRRGGDNPARGAGSFNMNDGMLNELRVEEIGRQYGTIVLGPMWW